MKNLLKKIRGNKKAMWIALGALALVIVGTGALYGMLSAEKTPTLPAMAQPLSDSFYEDGVVRASARSVVSADISAKVISIEAREGQSVQPGDILLVLDSADLEAQRALLAADRDAVLAGWEQSREQARQQIQALQAQRSAYNTEDSSRLYDAQIALLDHSMDPDERDSVAWSYLQMIRVTEQRMGVAGSDATLASLHTQLDAAKMQQLTVKSQLEQYEQQVASQIAELDLKKTTDFANAAIYQAMIDDLNVNLAATQASYTDMQAAADAQVTRLQNAISAGGDSYEAHLATKSELTALWEQYNLFLTNTKAQILALTAQQEQAVAASRSASSARSSLGDQIDLLEQSLTDESGTASYYSAQLARAEASLSDLDRKLAAAAIAAPRAGVVGAILAKEGEYIAAGSPITEVVDQSELTVECMLLTEDADSVRPGMRAAVIWERRDGDAEYPCTVEEVSALAVEGMSAIGLTEQRVKVTLRPDFSGASSYPGDGFQVRVRFITQEITAIAVPRAAVLETEHGDAVFVVRGGRAVLVPVTLGLEAGDAIAVLSGLSEEDIVVEDPKAAGIKEGDAVR